MMPPFETITAAVDYVQAARLAVHERNCPVGPYVRSCVACPPFRAAAEALDILRAANGAPSACAPARLVLHDAQCINGCDCSDRYDHADYHVKTVRELRRFVTSR